MPRAQRCRRMKKREMGPHHQHRLGARRWSPRPTSRPTSRPSTASSGSPRRWRSKSAEHGHHAATAICPGFVLTPLVREADRRPREAGTGISRDKAIKDIILAPQPTKEFVTVERGRGRGAIPLLAGRRARSPAHSSPSTAAGPRADASPPLPRTPRRKAARGPAPAPAPAGKRRARRLLSYLESLRLSKAARPSSRLTARTVYQAERSSSSPASTASAARP